LDPDQFRVLLYLGIIHAVVMNSRSHTAQVEFATLAKSKERLPGRLVVSD
jgi:hypothetical protein